MYDLRKILIEHFNVDENKACDVAQYLPDIFKAGALTVDEVIKELDPIMPQFKHYTSGASACYNTNHSNTDENGRLRFKDNTPGGKVLQPIGYDVTYVKAKFPHS